MAREEKLVTFPPAEDIRLFILHHNGRPPAKTAKYPNDAEFDVYELTIAAFADKKMRISDIEPTAELALKESKWLASLGPLGHGARKEWPWNMANTMKLSLEPIWIRRMAYNKTHIRLAYPDVIFPCAKSVEDYLIANGKDEQAQKNGIYKAVAAAFSLKEMKVGDIRTNAAKALANAKGFSGLSNAEQHSILLAIETLLMQPLQPL